MSKEQADIEQVRPSVARPSVATPILYAQHMQPCTHDCIQRPQVRQMTAMLQAQEFLTVRGRPSREVPLLAFVLQAGASTR